MSTLNELLDLARVIEMKLIESDGLITEEIEKLTTDLDLSLPQKVDSYAIVMDRIESNILFFKEQSDLFDRQYRGNKNALENMKGRLKELMVNQHISEFSGHSRRIKIQPSKPSLLIDEARVPQRFLMEVRTVSPDKDLIRAALTKGEKVDGCELRPTFALSKPVRKT